MLITGTITYKWDGDLITSVCESAEIPASSEYAVIPRLMLNIDELHPL